jgi:hypothetical protein
MTPPSGTADETTLPDELLEDIRDGGVGKGNDKSRSALFQSVVDQLKRRHWSVEAIIELLEKYPNGVAAKYQKRLRKEVERSYGKAMGGASIGAGAGPIPSTGATPTPGAAPAPQPGTAANPTHILPTIRLVDVSCRVPSRRPSARCWRPAWRSSRAPALWCIRSPRP